MTAPRRVDDVYPVLKQWAFLAHERAEMLVAAIDEFYAARKALNEGRRSIPRETWSVSLAEKDLAYESAIYRIQGESYFLMCAASQLVRILDVDPDLGRLPNGLHARVIQLRNVLEHWDEWTESQTKHGGQTSAARLRADHAEVWPFGFKFEDGDFVVGGLIPLSKLREALSAVWLWRISPPPGRIYPPSPRPSHPYPLES